MFGKPQNKNGAAPQTRPAAADQARIEGGGLVQIIVTDVSPLTFSMFLNNQAVQQEDVQSFSVSLEAPDATSATGTVRATLARSVRSVTGEFNTERTELFPCTIELIALNRRISLTCPRADSLEGAWISLGLRQDGSGHDLQGVKSLTLLLEGGLLSARLVWEDGIAEDLLPQ